MSKPRLKHRVDRKYGVNIWGRANSPIEKRRYRLGQHGSVQKKNISNYARQLIAKQQIKTHYNMSEHQLRNFFRKSMRNKTLSKSNSFMSMLEMRLDKVVERCIAKSIHMARQMVSHRLITVDDQIVNIPSYILKAGQVIGVRKKSQSLSIVRDYMGDKTLPSYIQKVGDTDFKITKTVEDISEIPIPFEADPISVVELLSRYL